MKQKISEKLIKCLSDSFPEFRNMFRFDMSSQKKHEISECIERFIHYRVLGGRTPELKVKIFITAFLQVFLGSANAFFIFKLSYIGIAMTGFLMSYLWTFNVKKIAFSNKNDRILYGIGAMFGGLSGVFISKTILNTL